MLLAPKNDHTEHEQPDKNHPPSSPPAQPLLQGHFIHVIGTKTLQNELLCMYLADQTGAEVNVHDNFTATQPLPDKRTLLLCDIQSKPSGFFSQCVRARSSSDYYLAFLNVVAKSPFIQTAIRLGAAGIFYQDESPSRLIKGIQSIFAGELWFSREALMTCLSSMRNPKTSTVESKSRHLTNREREILVLLARGATNDEIASRLFVSHHTVKTHIYNIFKKIDVSNRLQAANWAQENLLLYDD